MAHYKGWRVGDFADFEEGLEEGHQFKSSWGHQEAAQDLAEYYQDHCDGWELSDEMGVFAVVEITEDGTPVSAAKFFEISRDYRLVFGAAATDAPKDMLPAAKQAKAEGGASHE